MEWYVYVSWLLIVTQLLFLLLTFQNYRYVLAKNKRNRRYYRPRVALVVPCKKLDTNFEDNILSFYRQDYENYLLCFVVGDREDPAYEVLCRLKEKAGRHTKAEDVRILVSGPGQTCSQKIHNLLYAYRQIPNDIEVLAFADSDICIKPGWLGRLVHPLRHDKVGVASGYRWFVPEKNNFATLTLVAINAKVAQLLGNTRYIQAWGGSMAIKLKTFRELGIEKIWQRAVSDDLSLSYAVKKAHRKVAFVPGCIVASYDSTTWTQLFEFARRQFLITRVATPGTWWLGLLSSLYSVFGLWIGAGLAVYAAHRRYSHVCLFAAVPLLFFMAQFVRAILRQSIAKIILEQYRSKLKAAAVVDLMLFWLWSPVMLFLILSSAFGRIISWRGIRYRLDGPAETTVLGGE